MLSDTRCGVFRKLLRKHLSITPSQTYIPKELDPTHIKEDLKAVGNMVDLLEDVFTNPWKEDSFYELANGVSKRQQT